MPNLTERIRQIASDVNAGDADGTLRDEVEQIRNENDDRLKAIEQNVAQLLSDVDALKHQSGN